MSAASGGSEVASTQYGAGDSDARLWLRSQTMNQRRNTMARLHHNGKDQRKIRGVYDHVVGVSLGVGFAPIGWEPWDLDQARGYDPRREVLYGDTTWYNPQMGTTLADVGYGLDEIPHDPAIYEDEVEDWDAEGVEVPVRATRRPVAGDIGVSNLHPYGDEVWHRQLVVTSKEEASLVVEGDPLGRTEEEIEEDIRRYARTKRSSNERRAQQWRRREADRVAAQLEELWADEDVDPELDPDTPRGDPTHEPKAPTEDHERPLSPPPADMPGIRAWLRERGHVVPDRGLVPAGAMAEWNRAVEEYYA